MTQPAAVSHIEYIASGATATFVYPFKIVSTTELEVRLDFTVTANYSVTGVGGSTGGTIILFDTPPAGTIVSLRLVPLLEQTLDLLPSGSLPAEALEGRLDQVVKMVQYLTEELSRRPRLRPGSKGTLRDLEWPQPEVNKVLGWGSLTGLSNFAQVDTLVDIEVPVLPTSLLASFPDPSLGAIRLSTDGILGVYQGIADAWVRFDGEKVNVREFGASPGKTAAQNTIAIQAAVDAAAANEMGVLIPYGLFPCSPVRIKNGVRSFGGPGTLQLPVDATGQSSLDLDGTFFGSTPVTNCIIHDLRLDLNNSPLNRAVFLSGANTHVTVTGLRITNIDAATAPEAIRLYSSVNNCLIMNNHIILPVSSSPGAVGIYVVGIIEDQFGGYFANSGVSDFPVAPPFENFIIGNTIENGTHAISLGGTSRNRVIGNLCRSNAHRGIILSPQAIDNIITDNVCQDFGSSGIHLAYMSTGNWIGNNFCQSFISDGGEAGLQAYVGCVDNTFYHNRVICNSRYGVYLACNNGGCRVRDNQIVGYEIAGIALEADWASDGAALPGGATYSRSTTVATPETGQWTYANSSGNVIAGNDIYDPDGGATACGIYLAQIGADSDSWDLQAFVQNNNIVSSTLAHQMFIFEFSPGGVSQIRCNGNQFSSTDLTKYSFTRGRAHFASDNNNYPWNDRDTIPSFADADTTPSVAYGDVWACANTNPTSITAFDLGRLGQEITVRLDVNTTIVHNGSGPIRTADGLDITGTSDNIVQFLSVAQDVWVQVT